MADVIVLSSDHLVPALDKLGRGTNWCNEQTTKRIASTLFILICPAGKEHEGPHLPPILQGLTMRWVQRNGNHG